MNHTVDIINTSGSNNSIVLLVIEEDGSETYYRLSASHSVTLARVHAKKFMFEPSSIRCEDNSVNMDSGLSSFLNRFRYGRYTSKWNDIAEQIKVVEINDTRCLPHEYWVTFSH